MSASDASPDHPEAGGVVIFDANTGAALATAIGTNEAVVTCPGLVPGGHASALPPPGGPGMIPGMIRRSIRSITAAMLVALLGVLNTGMPSHSHKTERPATTHGHAAISADSHSHGVILLDAAERVPSTSAQVPALAVRIETTSVAARDRRLHTFDAAPLRPSERGPPPAAPRAPPQLI